MAASHLWRFNEIFSNADGTVQYIEMQECCGGTAEHGLSGKWVVAVNASNQFNFPGNISGNTANQFLLLATQGFADTPGAPTPDYIIPDGFVPLNGDDLEYWNYTAADWSYSAGQLPTDGVMALEVTQPSGGNVVVNSPTNFAGQSGSIDVGDPIVPATSEWGMLAMALVVLTVGTVLFVRRRWLAPTAN